MKNNICLLLALCIFGSANAVAVDDEQVQDSTRCTHGGQQVSITVPCFSACTDVIEQNCQPGPLRIGTNNATSLTLATNGCSDRIVIDENGAVVVNMPTAGEALTVNGNIVVPIVNAVGTQGIVKLGGTGPQRVNVYESGSQNFFAGAGAINSVVTGTSNISIGTTANSTLTTANNTIAIGTNAQATGTDSVVLGDSANSTFARTIVVGSRDSTSTGVAPTAGALNAIAIGSARGTLAGASAAGLAAIALGGSGGTFSGATASGDRSVAIGINATSSSTMSIAVGSASGTAGGIGATASTNINTIAIGSASGANRGALATGTAATALGGSDGTIFPGAAAGGPRSVSVGVNAVSSGLRSISIGSASGVSGSSGPVALGTDVIAIGSGGRTTVGPTASSTSSIALGSSSLTPTTSSLPRNIAIGTGAAAFNAGLGGAIAIGAVSDTGGGTAPVGVNTAAIAIGSAVRASPGAASSGVASIAIGCADGTPGRAGPIANANRTVAIGSDARSNTAGAIAIGSPSGLSGSSGPAAFAATAIAIGSGGSVNFATAVAATAGIALGSTVVVQTLAGATRSVAIGPSASTAQADVILLGNSAVTAVRVGIGIDSPGAKLDIVGTNTVIRFNQVNTAIGNAPTWLNRSTSPDAATTPLHYLIIDPTTVQWFGFTSSARYKTNIRSIRDESSIIYVLNPVLYDSKEGYGEGKDIPGFIAEEVHEVAPSLVIYAAKDQPENVAYSSLHALVIKELQKRKRQLADRYAYIDEQAQACDRVVLDAEEFENYVDQYCDKK